MTGEIVRSLQFLLNTSSQPVKSCNTAQERELDMDVGINKTHH